jgi:hypothetical protein
LQLELLLLLLLMMLRLVLLLLLLLLQLEGKGGERIDTRHSLMLSGQTFSIAAQTSRAKIIAAAGNWVDTSLSRHFSQSFGKSCDAPLCRLPWLPSGNCHIFLGLY